MIDFLVSQTTRGEVVAISCWTCSKFIRIKVPAHAPSPLTCLPKSINEDEEPFFTIDGGKRVEIGRKDGQIPRLRADVANSAFFLLRFWVLLALAALSGCFFWRQTAAARRRRARTARSSTTSRKTAPLAAWGGVHTDATPISAPPSLASPPVGRGGGLAAAGLALGALGWAGRVRAGWLAGCSGCSGWLSGWLGRAGRAETTNPQSCSLRRRREKVAFSAREAHETFAARPPRRTSAVPPRSERRPSWRTRADWAPRPSPVIRRLERAPLAWLRPARA